MTCFTILRRASVSLVLALALLIFFGVRELAADEEIIRTPDEIIEAAGGEITPEVVVELFTNCTTADAAHKEVRAPSRKKLIELGAKALPTLLKEYLSSQALYHRIEIVNVVQAIGHPAAEFLIPYLRHEKAHGRRYAAYLLGQTAAVAKLEDPYMIGPLKEDVPAVEALASALKGENEWQVLSSIVSAIGAMRDPNKVDLIASYLDHQEQSVRLSAAVSLGKVPHIVSMLRLMDALDDEEASVRGAAVLKLADTTNGDLAFDLLADTAESRDLPERKRLYALEAFSRYFDAAMADEKLKAEGRRTKQQKQTFKLAKRLLKESRSEGWNIRGHAVKLIASSGHPGAAKFLKDYSKREKHPFVLSKIDLALQNE